MRPQPNADLDLPAAGVQVGTPHLIAFNRCPIPADAARAVLTVLLSGSPLRSRRAVPSKRAAPRLALGMLVRPGCGAAEPQCSSAPSKGQVTDLNRPPGLVPGPSPPAPNPAIAGPALNGSAGWENATGKSYSITSSARASSDGGTVSPSALAVLRLITSSNLVGCSTGKSAGRVPRRSRKS